MDHFKVFVEFVTTFLLFYVFTLWPWSMWHLRSLTRDRTCCLFSHVQLFTSPWIVARQSPLSMGFSRQEYWSGLLFPSPGTLPYPGIKPAFLLSPALAGGFFTGEANVVMIIVIWKILDRNIFQFLLLMTWVLQCPPCVLYFWFPASGFLVSFSHVTALSSYTPAPPLVYTLGRGLGKPACAWMSHMCPSPTLGRKSFFLSSPFHSLISWNTVLSLRTVNLLSKWTNYTHCASLLFSDLADLLFIAFPKMFASSVPSNPASKIWHWGWKQI